MPDPISSTLTTGAVPSVAIQPNVHTVWRAKKRRLFATLIIAVVAFLSSVNFGVEHAIHKLLVRQAHSTGLDWAHQIEAQMPSLSNITGTKLSPDPDKFTTLANGILAVGNIYQIDVINPDCYCDISLGSYSAQQSKTNHGHSKITKHHHGIHEGKPHLHGKSNIAKVPSKEAVQHVFVSSSKHKARHLSGDANLSWPVDTSFTREIVRTPRHEIVIRTTETANQPATFAEIYHPVLDNGELSYLLRILVDLESERELYSMTLYGGTAFLIIILITAFGYPAAKYLKVSAKQNAVNARAHHLATYDIMTDTHNRNAFQEIAPQILRHCDVEEKAAVLVQFDTNNLKDINDYYDHQIGDKLLHEFARVLKQHLPASGHVARLGGDEFAVVIGGLELDDIDLVSILNLTELLTVSVENAGEVIEMSVSAGIAKYPNDGSTLEELMRNCDLALYKAKSSSDESVCVYHPEIGVEFRNRLNLRDEFRAGIENSEIEPFYQPLVNMNTGKVEGFEALARWNHPEKGILTPFVFEELLADRQIGGELGSLMLRKVVQDMKGWKARGIPFGSVGLNVGEGDLLRPDFSKKVISELESNGLSPHNLAIEITETCMFGGNKDDFTRQLEELRDSGCYVALDDFGTGYSSVTQIKELPCSALKIDKSFVNQVVEDKADQAIIQALLDLGNELNFKLVLEGVETKEQLELLRDQGCHLAQGYFYSRPVPASAVPSLIEKLNGKQNIPNTCSLAA